MNNSPLRWTLTGLSMSPLFCVGCLFSPDDCAIAHVSNKSRRTIVVTSANDKQPAEHLAGGEGISITGEGCWTLAAEPIRLVISTADGGSSVEVTAPMGISLVDITVDSADNIRADVQSDGAQVTE